MLRRTRAALPTLGVLFVFLVVVSLVQAVGLANRVSASGESTRVVANASEAFALMRELGLKGHVIVFVGDDYGALSFGFERAELIRSLVNGEEPESLDSGRLPMATIVYGMARRLCRVTIQGESGAAASFMQRVEGVPVMTCGVNELPAFGEKKVIIIQRSALQSLDVESVERLTDPASTELVIVQEKP